MKASTILTFVLFFIIGVVGLVFMAQNALKTRAIPSLGEFLASTSPILDTENRDEFASTTTSTSTVGTSSATSTKSVYSILKTASSTFRIQIAKTPSTRELGLSGRAGLEADEGLLFMFPTAGSHGFWMKDMNFPIDIVWIDSSKRVVGVTENVSPDSYPQTFLPPQKVQYVLEL
ncbi:MAG: DUF192 domain-containing protein, partial [bacterium]|nr:DUF192 domain-containing protein [bacterium]